MGMDAPSEPGTPRRRWLIPAAVMIGAAACLLYWDNVSESLRFVEAETDRRGAAAAQLLARTAAPHIQKREMRGLYDSLRWLRESDSDAASGALFDAAGRMVLTNDPFYFNTLPTTALVITRSGRSVRHDRYDAFIFPMTDREGRTTGYAAVRVSRERLTSLALDAVRRTLLTGVGVAAILMLSLHLLMRRMDSFAVVLERRVADRTRSLSEINAALGAEIAGRQAAQEELSRTRDEALRMAKVKTEFVAKMSHEIRTPISGVIGMNEVLLSSGLNSEQFEYASSVKRCAESLLVIINDILDFSKIEAGKLDIDAIDFSPATVVEEVCELMAVPARRKGLEFTCLVSADTPAAVNGDPQRLRQVLMNLVGNAVKFTDNGDIIVECFPAGEAGKLLFSVSDTGVGVPAESRDKIFEDYVQADGSHSRRFGGTGLGLAISRSLVEKMGGSMGLEGRTPSGSRFWFSIRAGAAKQAARAPVPVSGGALRALVIEPHEPSRRAAENSLRAAGMNVESFAGDGRSLRHLSARLTDEAPIDFVLVDGRMSSPDGGSMAALLRSARATARARLVAAAYVADLRPIRSQLEAYDAWVRKPLRPTELYEAVSERKARAGGPSPRPEGPFAGRRILLAEDNPINARVALSQLSSLGVEADWVQDGGLALEKMAKGGYDLALMDCQMAGMDGYTAAARWREREGGKGRFPIIALTAHVMSEERSRCLAAGMDDHLSKPVSKDRLADCLRRWISDWDEETFCESADVGQSGKVETDLLIVFLDRTPRRIQAMNRHAADADGEALRNEAHALRCEAGFIGAHRLQSLCAAIEDASAGELIPSPGRLVALDETFDAARRLITASRWLTPASEVA